MYTTANTWVNPNPQVFGPNNFGVIGGTTITAFPGNPFPPMPPHAQLHHQPYHPPHTPHLGPLHTAGLHTAHSHAPHFNAHAGMHANQEALRRAREQEENNRRNQENTRRQQENARLAQEAARRSRENNELTRANNERIRRNQESLQRQLESNRRSAESARHIAEQGRLVAARFRPVEGRRPEPAPHRRSAVTASAPIAPVLDGPKGLLAVPPKTIKSAPKLIAVPPELLQRGHALGLETQFPLPWNNARLRMERGTLLTLDRSGRLRLPGPTVRGTSDQVIWNSDNTTIMRRGFFSMVPDENYETVGFLHTHPNDTSFSAADIDHLTRNPSTRLSVVVESGTGQMWMLLRTAKTRYSDKWGVGYQARNKAYSDEINRTIVSANLPLEAAVLTAVFKMATDSGIALYQYTSDGFVKVISAPK